MTTQQLPANFIRDFYSRTILFIKTLVDSKTEDSQILDRLLSRRVSVTGAKEVLVTRNGQFMAAMTVNLLARWCPNLTLLMPETVPVMVRIPLLEQGNLGEALVNLARAINPYASVSLNPASASNYHASIAVGRGIRAVPATVTVNCDGWISFVDTNENSFDWASDNTNPIGAYISACLGAAEVFKTLFCHLSKKGGPLNIPTGSLVFSTLDYGFRKGPFVNRRLPTSIELGSLAVISMGALNSAVLYALCSLPGVSGDLLVIEPQRFDLSNLNRYVILTSGPAIAGTLKVDLATEIAFPYFAPVRITPLDYQRYPERKASQIELAVVGVDNNKSRWDVQMDHPQNLICGGTERGQVTVSCHHAVQGEACVGCIYSSEDPVGSEGQPIPTISFISAFAGFLMAAEVLKTKVSELNTYKLDLLLDVEGLRSSSVTVRKPPKSQDCKCNCGRASPSSAAF